MRAREFRIADSNCEFVPSSVCDFVLTCYLQPGLNQIFVTRNPQSETQFEIPDSDLPTRRFLFAYCFW